MTQLFPKNDRALDALNVAVAGLRDGIGPLLTVFLIQRGLLNPYELSWALAIPAIAAMCFQIPVGHLYDRVKKKRYILILGATLMAGSAALLSRSPDFVGVLILQAVAGIAACIISVGIPSISMQVAKTKGLGPRLSRNEICSKIGNFGALGISGYVSHRFGIHWIFGVVIAFAVMMIAACLTIPPADTPKSSRVQLRGFKWRDCFNDAAFLKIVFICFLLQLTNAPLFMIFEQGYVPLHPTEGAAHISLALILTQIVILVCSLALAKREVAEPIFSYFAAAFFLIMLRGLVFATSHNDLTLGLGQLLDGGIAAVIILLPIRAVAALGGSYFNIRSATVGTAVGLGASISMVGAGALIGEIGLDQTLRVFAGVGFAGLVICLFFVALKRASFTV